MRAAPPTSRPISIRCGNLRFPATVSGSSGSRDFGISTGRHEGGVYRIPAACSATSPPRVFGEDGGFRRRRGPETDYLRRPAGARICEPPRPHVARFRADAKICDFQRQGWGSPEAGISGSRQDVMGGGLSDSGGAFCGVSVAREFRRRVNSEFRMSIEFYRIPAAREFYRILDVMGGGLLNSGGACSGVSVARFREGFRRKWAPDTD